MNFGKLRLVARPEDQAENRGFASHRIPRIDFDSAAIPDHHNASALGKHSEVLREVDVREHFSNEVYSAPIGDCHDLFFIVSCTVIQNMMRALLGDQRAALVCASSADDGKARCPGKLHTSDSNAAARAVHQYCLSGLAVAALEQCPICGSVWHTQTRSLSK